jgi:hypothetical protein
MACDYLAKIRVAQAEAETAVHFLEHWVNGRLLDISPQKMTISQAAQYLDVTVEMLRNWERNGLIEIPRLSSNHYRLYGAAEFSRPRPSIRWGYSQSGQENLSSWMPLV